MTAIALGARAAADLQQSDPKLLQAAAEAVDDLARREPAAVPSLHLALCVWALDALIPDRTKSPWESLREHLATPVHGGVDEPLWIYAAAVAAFDFDANKLVRDLIGAIGTSPSPNDACVMLWLATAAGERLAQSLEESDNALKLLFQRREAIIERLALEIDSDTFLPPELEEFGEPIPESLPAISFLSSFEALLVDLALASPEEAEASLTFPAAKALFGKREQRLLRELGEARELRHRREAWLLVLLGLAAGVAMWLGLERAGWADAIAESLAVTTAAAGAVFGALKWRAGGVSEEPMELMGLLFITIALVAAVNAGLKHYGSHRIHETDLAVGGILAVVILAAWALGKRTIKKSPPRPASTRKSQIRDSLALPVRSWVRGSPHRSMRALQSTQILRRAFAGVPPEPPESSPSATQHPRTTQGPPGIASARPACLESTGWLAGLQRPRSDALRNRSDGPSSSEWKSITCAAFGECD